MLWPEICVKKRTEARRIHGFPENALLAPALKKPYGKEPGEVDGIRPRPVVQFPWSSPGCAPVSPAGAAAGFSSKPGTVARVNMPMTSSSSSAAQGRRF